MSRRAPVRRSGIETHDRILEVSLGLFIAESYRGTSVRDIADEVGVTQPTLYYHFGSKEGILAALTEPLIEAGERLLEELSTIEGVEETVAMRALEGYYDLIADHLTVFQFIETDRSVRSHPGTGHRLADQAARFLALLAGTQDHDARLGAAAAMGAIRRALRLPGADPDRDRETILRCGRAALAASG